jgi:HD-GYP domain-containing protein (c-di-GMP phosphodiesterase class II)
MAALSLATDLGMGQPLEQTIRTCLLALGVAERMGMGADERATIYYVALLRFLGCTADAHEAAAMAGGDEIGLRRAIAPVLGAPDGEFMRGVLPNVGAGQNPLRRIGTVATMMRTGRRVSRAGVAAHCEAADLLAERLKLSPAVRTGLSHAFERWNGSGLPDGIEGDAIDMSARIVFVARDVEVLARASAATWPATVRKRSGGAYDPDVAHAFVDHAAELLERIDSGDPWADVLEAEPEPHPWVPEGRLDSVLEAFADFVDMKSPSLAGHSRGVAELAGDAAQHAGVSEVATDVRRAGLVHDLGRASVPDGIWDKRGPLTSGEWERVRLHPYYTERVLSRSRVLSQYAACASAHHERCDGGGYHRGLRRDALDISACILAAADSYDAMTHERPHRAALPAESAASQLRAQATAGRMHPEAVEAVLVAAGHARRSVAREWPAGLTDREIDVLRLICRGATNRLVARRLSIAPATVDHHLRHIYNKTDVKSRAGATLFALQNGLLE